MTPDHPIAFALPKPISTNTIYNNVPGVGRRATKTYKAWRKLAAQYLMAQGPLPKFDKPVDIVIYAGEMGVSEASDSDNTQKAPIDALKKAGIIVDDNMKWVRSSRAVWIKDMEGMVAYVSYANPAPLKDTIVQNLKRAGRDLLR